MTTMKDYSAAVFAEHVGDVFEFERTDVQPPDRVQLQLVEVSGGHDAATRPSGLREPFSLLFALHGHAQPGHGLHRITHRDFEPCDWFLSRVTVPERDRQHAYYQAVFG